MRGACENAEEAEVFHSRCAVQVANWTQLRKVLPVLVLHVSHPAKLGLSSLGTGQLMSAVYRFHVLCLRLQRSCYLQLYRSAVSQYFGYSDGTSWDPSAIENNTEAVRADFREWKEISITVSMSKLATSARYIEANLFKRLRNETAPFLRVLVPVAAGTRLHYTGASGPSVSVAPALSTADMALEPTVGRAPPPRLPCA